MRATTLIRLFIASLMFLAALIIFRGLSAQSQTSQIDTSQATPVPIYNPYPPGILPADLNSEINRVLREISCIENRAITRWHNLRPPIVTGQTPDLKNKDTEAVKTLGKHMNFHKIISQCNNQTV